MTDDFHITVTLHELFALAAPPVPAWFEPVMRPEPERDELASTPEAAEQTAEWQAWRVERERERVAQWPWAFASMVMARQFHTPDWLLMAPK